MKKFESKLGYISYTLSKKLDHSPYLHPIIDIQLLHFIHESLWHESISSIDFQLWQPIQYQLQLQHINN